MHTIDLTGFSTLLGALADRGYQVKGPVVRDGAVVYDDVHDVRDFPAGTIDEQEPGRYRLHATGDPALFDHTAGPTSWKPFLHPPSRRLFRARRTDGQTFEVEEDDAGPPRYAFVGVRPCDLASIRILDRVLTEGPFVDRDYAARREGTFVVAVNCTRAGHTCFCASMGTGPEATDGFDLVLTELVEGDTHLFTVEVGSERGRELMNDVPHRDATLAEADDARAGIEHARRHMGRELHVATVKDLLEANRESAHWDDLAERCMACGNCTMACPTCFCTTVEDATDLEGATAERRQRWDSCFTSDFSYVHGGAVRPSTGARYRQWITHKLAGWVDQFGSPGCVGCGRCITWCPVGIDITAEVRALDAATPSATRGGAA